VAAEKGGIDPEQTRAAFPRVANLPFDSDYKLMATFHRMHDETGATSSAASSRARLTSCSPAARSRSTRT
jgi:magnesium-transporting ATPase (P-type)